MGFDLAFVYGIICSCCCSLLTRQRKALLSTTCVHSDVASSAAAKVPHVPYLGPELKPWCMALCFADVLHLLWI